MTLQRAYLEHFGSQPSVLVRAPGRVNLLGEHVDYNDGPVLPMAIDREVRLAAAPSNARIVRLYAIDLDQSVSFTLDNLDDKLDIDGEPLPGWARYPAGVAWALMGAGYPLNGTQVAYTSDIPIGSGLSSSAAIEVGFGVMWETLNEWNLDRFELARICQHAENEYVGVACGLMDQFASACGVQGHALYFDTRTLEWDPAPLPQGTSIVIAESGVRHRLTTSAYNDRRAACESAVEILRQYTPGIQSLRDIQTTEFMAYKPYLPEEVGKRAEHVVKEIARVESALSALHRGDADVFGALMFSGHASLRDLYEVSTPELDSLVEIARNSPVCYGARLTGAGFGGSTVNLVQEDQADNFIQELQISYLENLGRQVIAYLCEASQGASANLLV